jgi:hypothetical protein
VKRTQSVKGTVAVALVGVAMWSGYGYVASTGKLDGYRPIHLASCAALTMINPGCWIGYAQSMGAFDSLKNLATMWKPDALSRLGGPKSFTWKPEIKCGRESYQIDCKPVEQWRQK